jgi:energy-coupling factor transport system substrate-specific component
VTAARRAASGLIYALSGVVGVLAFIYPFFADATQASIGRAHSQDAPLVTAALVGLSVISLLLELQGGSVSAKTVALLGVLVAISSVLRFLEVAFPLPGGFSPIFAPVMLAGYVFGARFGFQMGAFTLLVSALVTGTVGPWLPYQMFAAGWAGMSAGWLGQVPALRRAKVSSRASWVGTVALAALGFAWGLLYGAIMNLYFWPFASGPAEQAWTHGLALWETLRRYGVFYLATSLAWDMVRSVGNVLLLLFLGPATITALTRFRQRFYFDVEAANA